MIKHRYEPYRPAIRRAYPEQVTATSRAKVVGVDFIDDLFLTRSVTAVPGGEGRETEYIVKRPYRVRVFLDWWDGHDYQQDSVTVEVPAGMLTDLTSVPRLFRPIVGRVGRHLEAAIVHDFLFIAWQDMPNRGARREDFRFANDLFYVMMRASGVWWHRRVAAWLGVASFVGWMTYKGRNPGTRYAAPDLATKAAPEIGELRDYRIGDRSGETHVPGSGLTE